MTLNISFSLPFTDPVLVFFLALIIILFAPIFLKKLKIPSIVGLIIAGVLIGPHGFNLLLRDSSIILFGTVGLLYIMFLAALELDMEEFKKNKYRSLTFGMLVFSIPIITGVFVCYYFLKMDFYVAVFVSNIFSTYTLVAYPIISRLGIAKNEAVMIAVGGVIIADTSVLLLMTVIKETISGMMDTAFALQLTLSIIVFAFIVLWLFPIIGRWFFRKIISDSTSQFIFILAMIFLAAFLSQLAGIEPIIGAFLAGLSLNRLIPHTSPLMNRIEFVGNALFIPFFLISVGMLVDPRVLFKGTEALKVAGAFVLVTLTTKWVAAYITQKLYNYSITQRKLLFGLSTAKAAATIAIVMVGFNVGIVDENILNGTILLILVTCLVSTFVVDSAGRKLALEETQVKPGVSQSRERILVPLANPNTIEQLIDFSVMIKRPNSEEPIYPLIVVKDDTEAKEKIISGKKLLEKAAKHASATESKTHVITRIDLNAASGILRAAKEFMITDVVIGWHGKAKTTDRIFGTTLDDLLRNSEQMILVTKILHPLNTVKRVVAAVPPNAEKEVGFKRWLRKVKRLSKQTGAPLLFLCTKESQKFIEPVISELKPKMKADFQLFSQWKKLEALSQKITPDDLLIVISARQGSISYHPHLDHVPRQLGKIFNNISFVIIYPQPIALDISDSILQFQDFSAPIPENIRKIGKLNFIKKFLRKT